MLGEGGVSRGEAPRSIRSAQRKILASFGGLEAISVRKRHYQFGKPRPPNWAIFLLNILLLTQNQKSVQPLFKSHQLLLQWWDYYGQPTSYFLWRVCPPYRPKCPKMGFKLGLEPIFFAAWRGPTRERMVRSTPPPRSGAEGKFFTPKAYLHTSFCVQKMGDPELSFRLHRVLFCVEHKSTLHYVALRY